MASGAHRREAVQLSDQQLAVIRHWAEEIGCILEVRLFGSRARGEARPYSDVDLALTMITEDDGNSGRGQLFSLGAQWRRQLAKRLGLPVGPLRRVAAHLARKEGQSGSRRYRPDLAPRGAPMRPLAMALIGLLIIPDAAGAKTVGRLTPLMAPERLVQAYRDCILFSTSMSEPDFDKMMAATFAACKVQEDTVLESVRARLRASFTTPRPTTRQSTTPR
jgi:predicted nucleotidyltransferase